MAGLFDVITLAKKDLDAYARQAGDSKTAFRLNSEANLVLSEAVRKLETKRQTGSLTLEETTALSAIDELFELMARVNQSSKPVQNAVAEPSGLAAMAKISNAEADQIIDALNRQFESKVLSRLDASGPDSGAVQDFSLGVPVQDQGRSLNDFLGKTKASDLPKSSFADEDSFMDLSKIYAARQKN